MLLPRGRISGLVTIQITCSCLPGVAVVLMAASAFGFPSSTRLAAAGEQVFSSSSSSSSSSASSSSSSFPSPASRSSSAFCASSCKVFSESRRGSFRVSSLASLAGPPWVRLKHSRVRSSFQADAGVAEPSASSTEAPLSPASSSSSAFSVAEANLETGPPAIDLEFLGLEQGRDGSSVVDKVSVISGEKLLRTVMNEQKLELYGLYGKIMNCGGGGSCGTCIVEVLEGSDLLNARTDAEERYLKKNPSTWRLACQTIVGDKSNSGKVVVQRLPQKKK